MAEQPPARRVDTSLAVKALAIATGGLLIAAGLCGVGFWNDRSAHDGAPSTFDILGGLAFVFLP